MSELEVVKIKTSSLYEEKVSYSRVTQVGDMIFVANTAGLDYKTRIMSPDAREQALQCFKNIEAALAAVDATLADVVRSRVAIPYAEDKEAVMAVLGEKFKGIDPASTITATPLAGEYRVEIEVTAHRGVGQTKAKYIKIDL
ncbi:RidA family protein [Allorhizobium borbori]|uniref:Enamine deaminase RidA (YjgF/YER057c/UK114 family) n=1 Tax=Allorhizobium borbori TaxID=485907 RepID=A0A7W6P0K0_9HYPH|nr:RidA family protein [Allorhizobium borbori]MBB4103369.1 enamine deaminase RidA (YjgF/YER057c/UK114 family) [Allorhizobium borbori]